MSSRMFAVVITLAAIAAAVWHANVAEAQFATDGLVSYWPLDSSDIDGTTVKDAWGSNDGIIEGDPKIVEGKIREALEFDGADDYINCGTDASLNLTGALTIEVWIKPAAAGEGGANVGPACKAQSGVSPWSWQLRYNAPGGFMGFQFNGDPEGSTWISVQENLSPGEWYHIAGTFDGSSIVCYLNGVEKDRGAISGIQGGDSAFFIAQDGWDNVFNGVVDEVRIYSRALSEAEVQQNYAAEPAAIQPAGKLTGTWGSIKAAW